MALLMKPLPEPLCAQCGRPILSETVEPAANSAFGPGKRENTSPRICHLCRRQTYDFDIARSFGRYSLPMSRAILLFKYGEVTPLGGWFAKRLAGLVRANPDAFSADVLVPVPLDAARFRERGYNQAELIARPLARILGIPFRSWLLVRTKPRPDKIRLTRRERWETVRGAYAAHKGAQVDKLRVLLVDDVFTTGATLDACSRALRQAGASRVVGLTVARALSQLTAPDMASPYQDLGE